MPRRNRTYSVSAETERLIEVMASFFSPKATKSAVVEHAVTQLALKHKIPVRSDGDGPWNPHVQWLHSQPIDPVDDVEELI